MDSTDLESRAQLFAALSDPIRLRILDALVTGQRCGCELHETLEIAPNLLSYHLRVLREAHLVEANRRGRWVDYVLSDGAAESVADALPAGITVPVPV